mmetsp:Transcript_68936/g.166672  ORF Transcript_68936/g.166672 Transcript_68936/m.166672 type:complete len:214 (-) Transcript_68936:562-1203(-)
MSSVTWLRAAWCSCTMGVMTSMSSFLISPESMRPDEYSSWMCCSFASSCRKKVSHWYEMSTAQSPPSFRCSSTVSRPPEKAYLLTLSLICLGVSVQKMAEASSEALIFESAPCSAGKNLEWISAGLPKPRRGATSLVMRKYGSWSMAHGMRQGTVVSPPKMCGKEDENDGAACTAGKACLPMLTESSKPKMPLTWLYVVAFCILRMFGYMCPM